ncbi:hypothetical protein EDD86DRAFT_274485 [Gorgonomyces haynaldii]|nr:hypothetical protein EDD86DRAFT_274485 [Gorgonomyces haynaldii]
MSYYDDRRDYRRRRDPSPEESYKRRRSQSPRRNDNTLMSFSQFADMTRDQLYRSKGRNFVLEPEELDRRYDIYKENHMKRLIETFFNEHSGQEWFRLKYHPRDRQTTIDEIKERKRHELVGFLDDLKEKKFDSVSFDYVPREGEQEHREEHEEEEMQEGTADNTLTLFIKQVPIDVKRSEILDVVKGVPGFKFLSFSDPRIDKRMSRFAWVTFEKGFDMREAYSTLEGARVGDFSLRVAYQHNNRPRNKILTHEFNTPQRLEHDLKQIKSLAVHLDQECGLDGNHHLDQYLETLTKDMEEEQKTKKTIDFYVEYLNKVHFYDYYSGLECASPEDHQRRLQTCLRHTRPPQTPPRRELGLEKVDESVLIRMDPPSEGALLVRKGGKPLDVQIEKALSLNIRKEGEGKYRCTECQKLFKGDEFVRKHIRTKHPSIIDEETEAVLFYNYFALDNNKLDLTRNPQPDRPTNRDRYGSYSNPGRRPPPPSGRRDPRQVRSYHDLDAPVGGEIQLKYD